MNKLLLRKANIKDAHLLYEWAIDPAVREGSFNTGIFSYSNHIKWLKNQLKNPNCCIYICYIDDEPIGQTRLYYEEDKAIINYSIAKEQRRKGYASLMIESVINKIILTKKNIRSFWAEVKPGNIASIKTFEKLNFNIYENSNQKIIFVKTNKLYIRVDMNSDIATGHLMRCLSIAKESKYYGIEPVFITADANCSTILKDYGYKNIILKSKWNNIDDELPKLVNTIKNEKIEFLLIDKYFLSEKYFRTIKKYTKIIYIDDLNSFKYTVDMLINYNLYYKKFKYKKSYDNTKLLLGTKYVPLRDIFRDLPTKKINNNISNILLLSGGTDNYGAIEKILNVLIKCDINIDVICGKYNYNYDKLLNLYSNEKIKIHSAVNNIEYFMSKADLAISAGGTTLYELCATGTPTITYIMADNQIQNVNYFQKEKLMDTIGDIRKDDITSVLMTLIEKHSYEYRKEKSIMMQKKIDGYGSKRIIEEVIKYN